MSQEDDIQKLIFQHNRRLQKLKEKEAQMGPSMPIEESIEIEDIEVKIKNLQAKLVSLPETEDYTRLRQEYLTSVREKYKTFVLSGLAPIARLLGASKEFRLVDVYVELTLRSGPFPLIEFERSETDTPLLEVSEIYREQRRLDI